MNRDPLECIEWICPTCGAHCITSMHVTSTTCSGGRDMQRIGAPHETAYMVEVPGELRDLRPAPE